ncbi:MAG: methionine--tRNA ligase, partial [Bacteroidota bacterium]
RETFEKFGVEFDIYHRTSSALHHATAQDFFKVLEAQGSFTKETTEQYFDEEYQQFLADRYITGECPRCGNPSAYGDQCERCGASLSPKDLINPVSTLSGKPPVLRTTTHWYLPMQDHANWLRTWITEGALEGQPHHDPKTWKNNVSGQCLSWIDAGDGLQPRAMTRDLDWGVKVPVEGADGKVLYVWLDAPIGYISATKQWAKDRGKDWKDYWQSEDSHLVHFIGKDNIVFHCIIFPILLKAHGEFVLPVNVPANEFLNLEGDKISTSRNHAVWLHEYLEDFPGRQDELRYVLTAISPETKDSEFSWKDYQARVNNELVAILGNFVNRAVVLTHKYLDGKVPGSGADHEGPADAPQREVVQSAYEAVAESIEKFRFREGLTEAMKLARNGNVYLTEHEPWKLIKTDPEATGTVLYHALQMAAHLAVIVKPFLPNTSARLSRMLQLEELPWSGDYELLPAGHQLESPELLFKKVEDEEMDAQRQKLADAKAQNQAAATPTTHAPMKATISFDDFTQLDLRVGTILEAERVPKTDKLLKLKVDTGLDQRTVVSGIAEYYAPEEIIGRKVSLLLNLAPRKIRGVESQGMILMAETDDGKLSFLSPEDGFGPGAVIR